MPRDPAVPRRGTGAFPAARKGEKRRNTCRRNRVREDRNGSAIKCKLEAKFQQRSSEMHSDVAIEI